MNPSALGTEQPTEFFFPNKMGRIILLSFEDVLGRTGVNAVLNRAGLPHLINNYPPNTFDLVFSFDDIAAIHVGLDAIYGVRGGRTLAGRAGQTAFKYGLKEFGPLLGIGDLAFRLLPLATKLKTGLEVVAEAFARFSDQRVRLQEDGSSFYCYADRCAACWGRKTDSPCCHLGVGLLQEALTWVSGGSHFAVEESECIACGAASCLIVISKQPLD